MSLRAHSNHDLLKLLLGERKAKKLYNTFLSSFIFAEEGTPHYIKELAVARELVKRSLDEELRHRDALTSPGEVTQYLRVLLTGKEHEVFLCLFLTNKHHLITAEELFRGTITGTTVYPREVVKRALSLNAAAVIFAHNHPSGVAEPSIADVGITARLKEALSLVDIRVLDHVVVGEGSVVSMAERGQL